MGPDAVGAHRAMAGCPGDAVFPDLPPIPLEPWSDVPVVGMALVQLALARRLDLGAATVAVAGAVWWLAAPDTPLRWSLFGAAGWLAALAWARGARHGVGRPELTGVSVAMVGTLWAIRAWGGTQTPWLPGVGVGLLTFTGGLGAVLARERRGLRGQRVYHYRDVPVEGPGEAARPPG